KSANSESLRGRSRQIWKGLGKIRCESANPANRWSNNARCNAVYIRCAKTDIAVESQDDGFTGKRCCRFHRQVRKRCNHSYRCVQGTTCGTRIQSQEGRMQPGDPGK